MSWNQEAFRYEYPNQEKNTDWQYGVDTQGAIVGIAIMAGFAIVDPEMRKIMIDVTREELARTKPVQRLSADLRNVNARLALVGSRVSSDMQMFATGFLPH